MIRLEMLQVARLAPRLLGESAGLVGDFLLSKQTPEGGFPDRAGRPDLYYTVFGIDGLTALQRQPDWKGLADWVGTQSEPQSMDLVHVCCLARCLASISRDAGDYARPISQDLRERVLSRIEDFRSADGGYHPKPGSETGTAYGAFLGYAGHQDLGSVPSRPEGLIQSLKHLETRDGAWSNDRQMTVGGTNSTAAAVTLLRHLGVDPNPDVAEWLMRQFHPQGGFLAVPGAPMPDLLSTATALHALSGLGVDLSRMVEPCLDYVDSLWTNAGSFHGNWTDEDLDTEYTWYGLLTLGHLSL